MEPIMFMAHVFDFILMNFFFYVSVGYCAIYNIHLKKVYIDDDSSCEGKTTFNCPIHAYFSNETYRCKCYYSVFVINSVTGIFKKR